MHLPCTWVGEYDSFYSNLSDYRYLKFPIGSLYSKYLLTLPGYPTVLWAGGSVNEEGSSMINPQILISNACIALSRVLSKNFNLCPGKYVHLAPVRDLSEAVQSADWKTGTGEQER